MAAGLTVLNNLGLVSKVSAADHVGTTCGESCRPTRKNNPRFEPARVRGHTGRWLEPKHYAESESTACRSAEAWQSICLGPMAIFLMMALVNLMIVLMAPQSPLLMKANGSTLEGRFSELRSCSSFPWTSQQRARSSKKREDRFEEPSGCSSQEISGTVVRRYDRCSEAETKYATQPSTRTPQTRLPGERHGV